MVRKQQCDQKNAMFSKLLFSLGIFFDGNNIVKLVVDNTLSEKNCWNCCKVANNHCLNVRVHRWLHFRQIHILFIFRRFECYNTLIVKEVLYINKIKFCTSISKTVITYITLTVINISNNLIKQYYGIIKTFKVLVIVKKKEFSTTNVLI